jgi:hypothetical protein
MKNLIVIIFTLLFFSLANADIKKQVDNDCKELGFKVGTPELAKCKLELLILSKKMNLEQKKLDAAEAQADAAEATARATEMNAKAAESLARSSKWRNSQTLINKGQNMLSGNCTLGVNC